MIQFPHHVWKSMTPRELREFARAVFFLFAPLGPLTLLMDPSITQASWIRLVIMTVLCGVFSWVIVQTFHKPLRLVASAVLYTAIIIVLPHLDNVIPQSDVPLIEVREDGSFLVSEEQQTDIETKRAVFGLTAVACIAIGYALFVQALAKSNKRRADAEAEVQLAQAIHQSLLPKTALSTEWCEIAGASVAASHIGGDFFDIITISESKVLAVIADASGHGAGAGILSAMTKSGITQELMHSLDPSALLGNVNTMIHRLTQKHMFVTCALVLLDREAMTACLITAGHPPILRYQPRNKTVEEFRTVNLALGLSPETRFESRTVPVQPGDRFCLVTDGCTETTDARNEQFGLERIKSIFHREASEGKPNSPMAVISAVQQHSTGLELNDDLTAVVIHIR